MDSGIWEIFPCGLQNPGLWNAEYSLGVRNSTKDWTPESIVPLKKIWNSVPWIRIPLAYVARVSVWFRGKEEERPEEERDFRFGRAKNGTRSVFRLVYVSRSSFFAPKTAQKHLLRRLGFLVWKPNWPIASNKGVFSTCREARLFSKICRNAGWWWLWRSLLCKQVEGFAILAKVFFLLNTPPPPPPTTG